MSAALPSVLLVMTTSCGSVPPVDRPSAQNLTPLITAELFAPLSDVQIAAIRALSSMPPSAVLSQGVVSEVDSTDLNDARVAISAS